MFSADDTVVAISTPPGRGGIGVVRISGPTAKLTAESILVRGAVLEPRRATVTTVVAQPDGRRVDRVVATYFPGPNSYTGDDLVEISGHGSPVLLRQIVGAAVTAGARLAQPGEFTLRAFLSGRIDLVQAEAVGDLINAVTPLQVRAAFDQLEGTVTQQISEIEKELFDLVTRLEASVDFPEEGYHFVDQSAVSGSTRRLVERTEGLLVDAHRGRLVREGGQVVILGKPNVGKSTLFNRLLGAPRAIITDVPGTTRDLLTETLELEGIPVTLVDTAGIRQTADAIESEGVSRARGAVEVARLVILVLDQSRPFDDEDAALLEETRSTERVIVINKTDLLPQWSDADLNHCPRPDVTEEVNETVALKTVQSVVRVSLLDADATVLTRLLAAVREALLAGEELRDPPAITNLRHVELLQRTRDACVRAAEAAEAGAPEELVLADLADAQHALEEVTGKRTADDVLNRIFAEFCIGK